MEIKAKTFFHHYKFVPFWRGELKKEPGRRNPIDLLINPLLSKSFYCLETYCQILFPAFLAEIIKVSLNCSFFSTYFKHMIANCIDIVLTPEYDIFLLTSTEL